MRLEPILNPKSLILKVVYWITKREFGKVISPVSIIYSRSTPILWASNKLATTDKKLSLSNDLKILIRYFVSHTNDCKFCSDLSECNSQKNNDEFQKMKDLINFRKSSRFTDKEKVVLAYLEEIAYTKTATDQTFGDLKKFFNEKEIVEITWISASENYFNLLLKPLGLKSDELLNTSK